MSSLAFLLVCVQICLIQNVYSQCCNRSGPSEELGAYGGNGIGNVSVQGELPVGGSTLLRGQVPVLGEVRFDGPLPACGSVTISGQCSGCGCGGY